MNAVNAEAQPASRWRVLGTAGVLLVLGAVGAFLAQGLRALEVDGAARAREYFGDSAPPFGLVLAEALGMPSGEKVVRFARPEPAAGPNAALFIEYPSRAPVEALLSGSYSGDIGMRVKEWERDPKESWNATIKRDELEWGTWHTKWIVERSFHAGGGWHEEARVDLGTKARQLVLFVHWPDQTPADEKQVLELLGAFRMPAGA